MKTKAPTITVIPATIDAKTFKPLDESAKKSVAAYVRVSDDTEEQLSSYHAQEDYYTNHIKSNPQWTLVKVYGDKGITGTNTKKRDEFKEMVEIALDGKIDLIITKSISRFARNTVDTLSTVRKLKEKGVEVYFEKENIHTLDSKGELLITIMSSLAQEESRSISENVTWGQRKRMADGKVNMPYGRFLGYEKGADATPQIVESEAETVRKIYALFLGGETYRSIADILTAEKIRTPSGLTKWSVSTVRSILQNEKYAGNAILQKKFTVDFLTKKQKVNEGEVPQYYVENSHPAIVPETTYNLVQDEIRRRAAFGKRLSGSGMFFGRIVCGQCGGFCGSKVWHSNDKYRRIVWQCNNKYSSGQRQRSRPPDQTDSKTSKAPAKCATPHLNEDAIKSLFVAVFGRIFADKACYLGEVREAIAAVADSSPFDEQTARLQIECARTSEALNGWIAQNAKYAQDQATYKERYDLLVAEYDTAKEKLETLEREKKEHAARKEQLLRLLALIEGMDAPPSDFDERLWRASVEGLTIYSKAEVFFTFKGGIKVGLDQNETKT